MSRCPLTGHPTNRNNFGIDNLFEFPAICDIGGFIVSYKVHDDGFSLGKEYSPLGLTESETESLIALARTKVWLATQKKSRQVAFLSEEELADISGEALSAKPYQVITPAELWREARSLPLRIKALRTLQNIALAEPRLRQGAELSVRYQDGHTDYVPKRERMEANFLIKTFLPRQQPYGMLFACTEAEGCVVLDYMLAEGWIEYHALPRLVPDGLGGSLFPPGESVQITIPGYVKLDDERAREWAQEKEAFLICRFSIPVVEDVYAKVYSRVGMSDDLQCPIYRVKDREHIDKIDDRILNDIGSATLVIVDLTEGLSNVNIGFEAGFAMGLNKPIIWTMMTEDPDNPKERLPFDIFNMNVMFYKSTDAGLADFAERLEARMKVAIEKANPTIR